VLVSPEEWGLELSRYLHLNPVRVRELGLSKAERQQQRQGAASRPEREQVKERLERLARYAWSSYRAYIGLEPPPDWLECEGVLRLGGGRASRRRECYREYVEAAVRGGLAMSPWEELREQVLLGGEAFVEKVRGHVKGDPQEQRGAARLGQKRPGLERVIACVERVRGARWKDFRHRHGDRGRELVLYLGRSVCGMKLSELARAVGARSYASVAMAIGRYAKELKWNAAERERVKAAGELLNVKM
jgi:hypothetical protein